MKRLYLLCLASAICFLVTACGTMESSTESIITESPIIEIETTLEPEPSVSPSPSIETDHFIGEYIDPEADEHSLGLQISKDEDGYRVEFEVLGKYYVPRCLSELKDGKIEFLISRKGETMYGTVAEEDGVATVTFLEDCWDVVHAGDTFIYHKISDIPYEQYDEWIKEHPSPSPVIKEEDFIGEYNADMTNCPNLEIIRKEDGTFRVEFIIYRIYMAEDGIGKFVNNAIEFTFENWRTEQEMKGRITLHDGVAILTILSDDWKDFDTKSKYSYYKVSDIPYEYVSDDYEPQE